MPTPRFCSQCGERLKLKRATVLPFQSYCSRCAPRFARTRFWFIAAPALCVVLGFAIGHYAGKREPFYYIGTPVNASQMARSPDGGPTHDEQTLTRPSKSSSGVTNAICGAPTKSGKPCQRKVKGGGYCWQHRDKFGDKPQAPTK